MDTMDTLFRRKSIRSYTGEKISKEDFDVIMRATDSSPVGRAKYENLHVTIVENPKLLKEIDEHAAKEFGDRTLHPLYGAPTFIIVSAKNDEGSVGNVQFSNAAILVETMTIAAVDLGVGHCDIWGAVRVLNDDLIKKLDIPEGFTPCCGLILGKSDEKYEPRDFPENRISKNIIE